MAPAVEEDVKMENGESANGDAKVEEEKPEVSAEKPVEPVTEPKEEEAVAVDQPAE